MTKRKPVSSFRDHPENINRKGRPKLGLAFAELVRAVMEEENPRTKKSKVESMVDVAIARAMKGSWQFYDALTARAYGKVPDKIELNQEDKPDLSKLTDEEIKVLTALLEKAKRDKPG
jgi:hypothetical protein